ncbi:MAG: DUF5320 domain-containing protein [Bacteroidales bacterium]
MMFRNIEKEVSMPKLDGTGPDGKGILTGRGLGRCSETSHEEKLQKLGEGRGLRRKAGEGNGKGKRLRYDREE